MQYSDVTSTIAVLISLASAYFTYSSRKEARDEKLPLIEPSIRGWEKARQWIIEIRVQNRRNVTIDMHSIRLRSPKGAEMCRLEKFSNPVDGTTITRPEIGGGYNEKGWYRIYNSSGAKLMPGQEETFDMLIILPDQFALEASPIFKADLRYVVHDPVQWTKTISIEKRAG